MPRVARLEADARRELARGDDLDAVVGEDRVDARDRRLELLAEEDERLDLLAGEAQIAPFGAE